MSDHLSKAMFGEDAAADPYEGLPRHMIESIPHTVEVTVKQPKYAIIGGERKLRLDARPDVYTVQLERDGVPLTKGMLTPGWTAGEREGWSPR